MTCVKREVAPEILDRLDAGDARARRSRRDLRLINRFMRGEAWIVSELKRVRGVRRVVDLGAGDGCLAIAVSRALPDTEVVGVDLAPRPQGLDQRVTWWQGDLFDFRQYDSATAVVANLFLHHLCPAELVKLGGMIRGVCAVLAAEPYRAKTSLFMARCLFPLVNDVTRHDMMVSIRAGFRKAELGDGLGCDMAWHDQRACFGGIRVRGVRK